ncbi:MAG TPA: SpoIVB peptidase S55 domain-containing protein [Candidatus Eisenbacteria bacterium]|nr:SpoIVB peptidase S55 domain-containing protein [Candidatus Eisenbacteria bacterium]
MIRTIICLLGLVLAGSALAEETDAPAGWDNTRFMSVRDIRPGMKGIGRSVFQGTKVEEFQVEILGLVNTPSPRGTMIMAQLSGHDLENVGVVAGMSGSPIYIDGKLIGALAFGWSFSSRPVAGITPIEEMLRLEARPAANPALAEARSGMVPEDWQTLLASHGEEALAVLSRGLAEPSGSAAPWSVPLTLSGFPDGSGRLLSGIVEQRGFFPMEAGSAGAASMPDSTSELVPGSAVAVELVRGDAQLAAIGTLTWRDGNRVWAFGHPMLNLGATAYPLSQASIVTVMPRLSTSFKMGGPGTSLGAITRDYSAGVMGELGAQPRLIPLDVDLAYGGKTQRLHYEVLDAEAWTPVLVGFIASSTIESLGRASGAATLRIRTGVTLADGDSVESGLTMAGFTPPAALAGEVARVVGLVHGNPFEPTRIQRIGVEVHLDDAIDAAFLEGVTLDRGQTLHSGDALPVRLDLRGYRGEPWTKTVNFQIPEGLPPGSYRLLVCDGAQAAKAEAERAPGGMNPRSLKQLSRVLAQIPATDAVVVRLLDATSNPVVSGDELPRLPGSLRPVVQSPLSAGKVEKTEGTILAEERVSVGRVVLGSYSVPLSLDPKR